MDIMDFVVSDEGVDSSTQRFKGASWYEDIKNLNVTVIGAGGIGSWLCLLLSRTSINKLIIYDDDIIDETNFAGQLHSTYDLGELKTKGIHKTIMDYTLNFSNLSTFGIKFPLEEIKHHPVIITAVDNMETRISVFKAWKKEFKGNHDALFIDGRLALEEFQIYSIRGNDIEAISIYEKNYLFDSKEAEEIPCSLKQTSYTANMIGTFITNAIINFVSRKKENFRIIPFIISYNASLFDLKIEE